MKKIIFSLLAVVALFAVATPASAAECQVTKVERRGFAYNKVVCINPTQPVRVTSIARSTGDGSATAIAKSFVFVSGGGNVSVSTTAIAITGGSTVVSQ